MLLAEYSDSLFRSFQAWDSVFLAWLESRAAVLTAAYCPPESIVQAVEERVALGKLAAEGLRVFQRDERWVSWLDYCVKELAAWRLIESHRAGVLVAFTGLTEIFRDKVEGIAAARVGDRLAREAVVWDTWFRIWRRLPTIHAANGFFTNYLGVVARRAAIDAAWADHPSLELPQPRDMPLRGSVPPKGEASQSERSIRETRSRLGAGLSPEGMEDLLWITFMEPAELTCAIVYGYRIWLEYDIREILGLAPETLRILIDRLILEYSHRSRRDQSQKNWAKCARARVQSQDAGQTLAAIVTSPERASECVAKTVERLWWSLLDAEHSLLVTAFSRAMRLERRTTFGYLRFLGITGEAFVSECGDKAISKLASGFRERYQNRSLLAQRRLRTALYEYLNQALRCELSPTSFVGSEDLLNILPEWRRAVQRHIDSTYSGPQAIVWDLVSV